MKLSLCQLLGRSFSRFHSPTGRLRTIYEYPKSTGTSKHRWGASSRGHDAFRQSDTGHTNICGNYAEILCIAERKIDRAREVDGVGRRDGEEGGQGPQTAGQIHPPRGDHAEPTMAGRIFVGRVV